MTFPIPDDLPEWAKAKLREPLQLPPDPQRDAWVALAKATQEDEAASEREYELARAILGLAKRTNHYEQWIAEMQRRLELLTMTPPDIPPIPPLDNE
jgi:hypothetical protein